MISVNHYHRRETTPFNICRELYIIEFKSAQNHPPRTPPKRKHDRCERTRNPKKIHIVLLTEHV